MVQTNPKRRHWDQRYDEFEAAYGRGMNDFLALALKGITTGTLLLPCDGEGRNGVGATGLGWNVLSFDSSEVGVAKAQRWASEAGVTLDARTADAFEFNPGRQFDVVALIFAHMPPEVRREFHLRVWSWLKPGGLLLVEGFHLDQLGKPSGGPRVIEMLYDAQTVPRDLPATADVMLSERKAFVLDEAHAIKVRR